MSETGEMEKHQALDNVLIQIGNFGRLQCISLFLISVTILLHSVTHVAYVFTAYDSEYRCSIPECENNTNEVYEDVWMKNAIPYDEYTGKPMKCSRFALGNSSGNCTDFDRMHIIHCDKLIFKNEKFNIVRQFELYCNENLWKLTLVGTLNTAGMFFGLLMTGFISDKYGRKFVLLVGMSLCGVTGLVKSLSPTYEWFCFFEFVEAVFAAGSYGCAFILGVELVTPGKRVIAGCITSTSYALGEALLALVAWCVQDWKMLIYLIYTPCVLLILLYNFIPESVRWYLSKGRFAESKVILGRFAKANNRTITEDTFEQLELSCCKRQENTTELSFSVVLKSRALLFRFLNCSFCWSTCTFLFYGLTLNSVSLSENSYLDFINISLIEIPAYWTSAYVVEKFGRKWSISCSFGITAISCFAFVFIEKGSSWVNILVYCVGKFGATSAFQIIYVISSEIFPTSVRHTTMGLCSMIGRAGSMASPQIPLLAQVWYPLPTVLFAGLACAAALTSSFFPETLNVKLPDTVEEAEAIGQEKKWTERRRIE